MKTYPPEILKLSAPLTLADIRPDWETPMSDMTVTKIYQGGSRIDNGWCYSYDGILRVVPPCIPRKHKGKKLRGMTVMVRGDGQTVAEIFAHYTGHTVEYGLEVE